MQFVRQGSWQCVGASLAMVLDDPELVKTFPIGPPSANPAWDKDVREWLTINVPWFPTEVIWQRGVGESKMPCTKGVICVNTSNGRHAVAFDGTYVLDPEEDGVPELLEAYLRRKQFTIDRHIPIPEQK